MELEDMPMAFFDHMWAMNYRLLVQIAKIGKLGQTIVECLNVSRPIIVVYSLHDQWLIM